MKFFNEKGDRPICSRPYMEGWESTCREEIVVVMADVELYFLERPRVKDEFFCKIHRGELNGLMYNALSTTVIFELKRIRED